MTRPERVTSASQWPEADALFRADPRWRGGDDAYTVELSPGRTLWLFGDSFVEATSRADAAFVRNSIAIQDGTDPASASIAFSWQAGAFFRAPGRGEWYWPLHGVVTGNELVLFMMRVRAPGGGTGAVDDWRRLGPLGFFEVFGWSAVNIGNPAGEPADWRSTLVAERTDPIVLGASVLADGDWLLAYGWDPLKRLVLARWPVGEIGRSDPEWWTGDGWRQGGDAATVIEHGATEFSVHRDRSGALCQVQMIPREQALAVRWAERPQGPWSDPQIVFRPEESGRPGVFVYAGKAHPHLHGAGLIATYASNAEVDVCLADESIYYPRFVRCTVETP